jgi:hypothetical protein
MRFREVGSDTERAFFTCLHLGSPEDLEFAGDRRDWYAKYKDRGYQTRVLIIDDVIIVGKCHRFLIGVCPDKRPIQPNLKTRRSIIERTRQGS